MSRRTLEALAAEVADLRERVASLEAHRTPPADRDVALVLALATAVDRKLFTAAEIFQHAAVDATLRRALHAGRCTNPRKLGKFLQRVADVEMGGLRVSRMSAEHGAIVWGMITAIPPDRLVSPPSKGQE